MVDGRIRKAEEDLVRAGNRSPELAILKEVRCEAIRVVPADGAEDHVDLRVAERREKVCRAVLRMILYMLYTGERVRHEPDAQPVARKAPYPDIQLMLYEALPQRTGGKAHDRNSFYHAAHPVRFSGIIACRSSRRKFARPLFIRLCLAYNPFEYT